LSKNVSKTVGKKSLLGIDLLIIKLRIMKWVKKGLIFNAKGQYEWMQTHITPATAIVLDDRIRIFFTTRSAPDINRNFISYSSFLDISKADPQKIIDINNKPILELGGPGMFDEFGTMVAKPVIYDKKVYLYYMGWQRLSSSKAPYQVTLGLAVSEDNGVTFTKVSNGPIMGIDYYDPISIGNVFVIVDNGIWKMWYTALTDWAFEGEKPTPDYFIKYAYSKDGIFWTKTNKTIIGKNQKGGVATPTIFKNQGIYHMLFGYRQSYDENGKVAGYRIGYASSPDLENWERDDSKAGIEASDSGWDSEMICYPHVVEVNSELLMFYSGNGFGKDGFGYAKLQD
jgi:hypothetical protein